MEKGSGFRDFDDNLVFDASLARALVDKSKNFVVEFGQEQALIAFDLGADELKDLFATDRSIDRPIRWINIWGPNKQEDVIDLLAQKYKFSPRLAAVVKTTPPDEPPSEEVPQTSSKHRSRPSHKEDVEAIGSLESSMHSAPIQSADNATHYDIAKHMNHYQSIDVGQHFLCIGANWMHRLSSDSKDDSVEAEGSQKPLWTWLVLCDDHTVLSLHEDIGSVDSQSDVQAMRHNTLSVLRQLSKRGHPTTDPLSMQAVRQALHLDSSQAHPGIEGASNLFYYLFDDWRAVYTTIATFQQRLRELRKEILHDMTRKSHKAPNIEIIPRLHILGTQMRQMQHLYEGYKNLTQRILEPKATVSSGPRGLTPSLSFSSNFSHKAESRGVILAQSASTRFERLGDRLQFLILSETEEFLAEKDALISTYFNINAQKDSESSARLTRSATLLAKLSVLFLPVSLMTAYFSVQIQELNHYTSKDYWSTFAVVMALSVLALFFFSRLLMYVTETLDGFTKILWDQTTGCLERLKGRRGSGRRAT